MKKRGTIKPVSGGRTILQELEYAENATYQRYSGYGSSTSARRTCSPPPGLTGSKGSVAVTISGLEGSVQNTGAEAIINLLSARIRNAEKTMVNNIWGDMYSSGTASSGKQIGGLQLLVADDPTTGTVAASTGRPGPSGVARNSRRPRTVAQPSPRPTCSAMNRFTRSSCAAPTSLT